MIKKVARWRSFDITPGTSYWCGYRESVKVDIFKAPTGCRCAANWERHVKTPIYDSNDKWKAKKRSSDIQNVTNMNLVDQGIQTDSQNIYSFFSANLCPTISTILSCTNSLSTNPPFSSSTKFSTPVSDAFLVWTQIRPNTLSYQNITFLLRKSAPDRIKLLGHGWGGDNPMGFSTKICT